ncbi:MAG: Ig-like domain-containing protein [Eubacterium sp.]|nr:Ig-like domain-containing protein [Eubacterium sp.]
MALLTPLFTPVTGSVSFAKHKKKAAVTQDDDAMIPEGETRDVRLHNKDNIMPAEYDREFFHVGDHGFLTFSKDLESLDLAGAPSNVRSNIANIAQGDDFAGVKITYSSDKPEILTIDEDKHIYRILRGGEATVILTAKVKVQDSTQPKGYREETWLAKFTFIIMGDTSGTKLAKDKITTYMIYDTIGAADVELEDCPDLKYYSFDYTSSNSEMLVDVSLDPIDKLIHVQSYVEGKSEITIRLNGHELKLTFENKLTGINKDHHVMDIGDSVQLKITKYKGDLKWKSTNKSVATVTQDGIVYGKKVGNAVVYAEISGIHGEQRIGCAVSVVKKNHTKVLSTAIAIGKTCLYSQPMRMQPGFYDCSSLVWRAYKQIGKWFGLKKYAPTAASECQWCAKKKRILEKWTLEGVQKMKYRPGDLLFRVGANNGRYLGIYHVEMFAGYRVVGFDGKTPMLSMCWANRPDDYYEPCDDLFARP